MQITMTLRLLTRAFELWEIDCRNDDCKPFDDTTSTPQFAEESVECLIHYYRLAEEE